MIKEPRYEINREEFEILKEMGFSVEWKSPYHVRISKDAYPRFFIEPIIKILRQIHIFILPRFLLLNVIKIKFKNCGQLSLSINSKKC